MEFSGAMTRSASSMSSASDSSQLEEWETASSGSGASSPSGGARLQHGDAVPPRGGVTRDLVDDGTTQDLNMRGALSVSLQGVSTDPRVEDSGRKDASTETSGGVNEQSAPGGEAEAVGSDPRETERDEALKRRMGSERFQLFQRQVSTNLDENSDSEVDRDGVNQDSAHKTEVKGKVTVMETPVVEVLHVSAPTEKSAKPDQASAVVRETLYSFDNQNAQEKVTLNPPKVVGVDTPRQGDKKDALQALQEASRNTKPEFLRAASGFPKSMSDSSKLLMASSVEEIDVEIQKRLSKLTGLLEDLSEMTGQKVKVDRNKVMTEVIAKVDPDFDVQR